jgi:hypothetical protein
VCGGCAAVGAEPVGCASGGGQGLRTSSRAMPFVGRVADRIAAARGLPRWVVFVSFGDCLREGWRGPRIGDWRFRTGSRSSRMAGCVSR